MIALACNLDISCLSVHRYCTLASSRRSELCAEGKFQPSIM